MKTAGSDGLGDNGLFSLTTIKVLRHTGTAPVAAPHTHKCSQLEGLMAGSTFCSEDQIEIIEAANVEEEEGKSGDGSHHQTRKALPHMRGDLPQKQLIGGSMGQDWCSCSDLSVSA